MIRERAVIDYKITDIGAELLVEKIVTRACGDWEALDRKIHRVQNKIQKTTNQNDLESLKLSLAITIGKKKRLEKFFESSWCEFLTFGHNDEILPHLRAKVEADRARNKWSRRNANVQNNLEN